MVVLRSCPLDRVVEGMVVGAEDDYYSWWQFESEEGENPGLFLLARNRRDRGRKVEGRYVNAVLKWRVLSSGSVPDFAQLAWVRPGLRSIFKTRLEAALEDARAPSPEGRDRGGPPAVAADRDEALRPRLLEGGEGGRAPEPTGVRKDLEELRRSVDRDRAYPRRDRGRGEACGEGGRAYGRAGPVEQARSAPRRRSRSHAHERRRGRTPPRSPRRSPRREEPPVREREPRGEEGRGSERQRESPRERRRSRSRRGGRGRRRTSSRLLHGRGRFLARPRRSRAAIPKRGSWLGRGSAPAAWQPGSCSKWRTG